MAEQAEFFEDPRSSLHGIHGQVTSLLSAAFYDTIQQQTAICLKDSDLIGLLLSFCFILDLKSHGMLEFVDFLFPISRFALSAVCIARGKIQYNSKENDISAVAHM